MGEVRERRREFEQKTRLVDTCPWERGGDEFPREKKEKEKGNPRLGRDYHSELYQGKRKTHEDCLTPGLVTWVKKEKEKDRSQGGSPTRQNS